jgi:hypothetical protein
MPIQSGTFKRLPPEQELERLVEEQRRHNADLTSYLWYIMPLAEKFGGDVYARAAESLNASGLDTSAAELEQLAQELKTPVGMERYAEQRRLHMLHVTG